MQCTIQTVVIYIYLIQTDVSKRRGQQTAPHCLRAAPSKQTKGLLLMIGLRSFSGIAVTHNVLVNLRNVCVQQTFSNCELSCHTKHIIIAAENFGPPLRIFCDYFAMFRKKFKYVFKSEVEIKVYF